MNEPIGIDQDQVQFVAPVTGGETKPSFTEKYTLLIGQTKKKIQGIMQEFFPDQEHAIQAPGITYSEYQAQMLEIAGAEKKAQDLSEAMLSKISEQLGSNPGGWYEHKETGEKYYIKYYGNPDRARAEFIANSIYARLGIPAAQSELFQTEDGRLAIASKEIPGSEGATSQELQGDPDVMSGFLADAFLANWDVVGLCYDNIVKSSDGRKHRIDNGGSLIFRAQGGYKDFSESEIPELQTMLNPEYPAGKVFAGISREQLTSQAQELLSKIDEAYIDALVDESGLPEDVAVLVRQGLKGRLKVIQATFGVEKEAEANPWQSLIEKLQEDAEKVKEIKFRGHADITVDRDKIEGQRLDLVDTRDLGYYTVYFKLTSNQYDQMVQKMQGMSEAYGSNISYLSKNEGGQNNDFSVAQAWTIEGDDMEIKISMPSSSRDTGRGSQRASLGLVEVKIKTAEDLTPEMIQKKLAQAFEKMELQDALVSPDTKAEQDYKISRYTWHHKIDPTSLVESDITAVAVKLERQEVFPGYTTMVEPGKSKEYQAITPLAIHHNVYDGSALVKIFKAGGLIATQERMKRGSTDMGMSSQEDMDTGGADSVFTRLLTHNDPNAGDSFIGRQIIFDPNILDRTDWYAYSYDNYGSASPKIFSERLSPEEILNNAVRSKLASDNEEMFRYGIRVEDMLAVAVVKNNYTEILLKNIFRSVSPDFDTSRLTELMHQGPLAIRAECQLLAGDLSEVESVISDSARLSLIDTLQGAGIMEINGVPVEDFIVELRIKNEMIDLTQARKK